MPRITPEIRAILHRCLPAVRAKLDLFIQISKDEAPQDTSYRTLLLTTEEAASLKMVSLTMQEAIDHGHKLVAPDIVFHGPVAKHNMACPVHLDKHAVLNCNTGIFHPSRKAEGQGFRLVQIRKGRGWLFNLLSGILFKSEWEQAIDAPEGSTNAPEGKH